MLNQQKKFFGVELKLSEGVALALILVGAILFRLLLMSKAYSIGFDEVNYLKLAASGKINGLNHVLHTYWSPFYPLAVALFSYLIPDFELAGRWLQILLSTGVIIPLFFFIKANYNHATAWGTALLIAFFAFSARYSVKAEAEFIFSFTAILGIILGWTVLKQPAVFKAAGVGILFGCSYLARPEGIGFLITFAGVTLVVFLVRLVRKKRCLPYLLIGLLSLVGFLIMAVPYMTYVHKATGVWTISTKGTVNQQGEMYVNNISKYAENPFHVLSEDNTRLLQDEIYHLGTFVTTMKEQGTPVVEIKITAFIKKVAENYYKLLTEEFTKVLTVPLLLLLGLGLFKVSWSQERAWLNLYLFSFVFFFWFMLIPAFHITLRYFIPLLPIAFIWIANGAYYLIKWFTGTLRNLVEKWPTWISLRMVSIILVVLFILAGSILPELAKRLSKGKYATEEWAPCIEQKKAGLWLKKNGVTNPIIMSYNHAVSFYADNYEIKESVEIPENTVDRVVAYAKHRGVHYLVVNDRYQHIYPLIAHLLDQKEVPPDLKMIYFDQEKNGLRTLIYEVLYQ